MGTTACCDPQVPGNFGRRSGLAGVWSVSGGAPEPDELVENLIDIVSDPDTALTPGQVSSLIDKLNNALASINAGQTKQAVNQLNAVLGAVRVQVKGGRLNTAIGDMLVAGAEKVISVLQSSN